MSWRNYRGYTFGYSRVTRPGHNPRRGLPGKLRGGLGIGISIPTALALLGLVWLNGLVVSAEVVDRGSSLPMTSGVRRGSAYTDVSGDRGAVYGPSAQGDTGNHPRKSTPRAGAQSSATYTTDFTRGMNPDDLTGYTLADLRLANAHFTPSLVTSALMISYCESRHDDTKVGQAGERGRYQIHPDVWLGMNGWPGDPAVRGIVSRYGPVSPDTLAIPDVNAAVASYIMESFGIAQWTTSGGCPEWE